MLTTAEHIQIFYEISMSIGSSLDSDKMLRQSLSTYLKKLNCSAGGILLLKEKPTGDFSYEQIYSIPRKVDHNKSYQSAIENISQQFTGEQLVEFQKRLPINGQDDSGEYFHIMDLPDYGLIVLIKSGDDFEPYIVNSLKPLNVKLASAANSCLQNEKLNESHQELRKSEIKFRNLTKNAPVALTRYNIKDNKYDFANDEFTRQSGYTIEEFEKLSEKDLHDMMHGSDRERVYETFKKWKDDGYKDVKRIDYRIINKNKEVLWLDT
nr:PAS domain-containing protein [Bacteroidota bacterium]